MKFSLFRRRAGNPDISPLVYILVILFGSSTWLSVTGVWVELPLMVSVYRLPESWNLPSFLAVIIQLAVLGPLLYWAVKKFFPPYVANSTPLIYFCLIFCTLSTLFMALFWNYTSSVFGDVHSTALFVLLFCVSLVSCTSSVLYLPTMFRFRPAYTTAYFIGMGVSALVPSVLALVQGSGRVVCVKINNTITNDSTVTNNTPDTYPQSIDPHFSVNIFYGMMFVWMCLASLAFLLLNILPSCKHEMNANNNDATKDKQEKTENERLASETTNAEDYKSVEKRSPETNNDDNATTNDKKKSSTIYLFLLIITVWSCALMNGILPSIQSFACLPYGTTVFHSAVILSNIANPTACFIPFFYNLKNVVVIFVLSVISTALSVYIIVLAAQSPHALFNASFVGSALCVLAWTFDVAILAYLRAVAGGLLRESGNEKYLFWCGICTQAGSFVGATVMFPLVNVYHYFQSAPSCQ